MLTTSCGKTLENTQAADDDRYIASVTSEVIKLSATLTPAGLSDAEIYDFDDYAEIKIPGQLKVLNGNAGNQEAKIYFNVDDNRHDFYCVYVGGASTASPTDSEEIEKGLFYSLDDCYADVDDDNIDDALGMKAGDGADQDVGNSIILEIDGADPRYSTQIEGEFELEWH